MNTMVLDNQTFPFSPSLTTRLVTSTTKPIALVSAHLALRKALG